MDDEQLALAAIRGDEAAFVRLLQSRKMQLYKIAYAYLRGEADALEAVQEVTCRAWLRIGKLKEPKFAGTWLVRIMIHYCVDESKRRRRAYPDDASARLAAPFVDGGESERLDKIVLDEIVDALEEPYRQVVRMKYYDDLTLSEIAREMNRPAGTVKTWLHKALGGMRQKLAKEGKRHG